MTWSMKTVGSHEFLRNIVAFSLSNVQSLKRTVSKVCLENLIRGKHRS